MWIWISAFSVLVVGLKNILNKQKNILIRVTSGFAMLYPICFSVAYVNAWIPNGLLYTGITDKNVEFSNLAYLTFLIVISIFHMPKMKYVENDEVRNTHMWTAILFLVFIIYFLPYIQNIGSILNANSDTRRSVYMSISSIVTFRIYINVFVCWALYSSQFRKKKICLIVSCVILGVTNGLSVFCGNRREVLLVALMLSPMFMSILTGKSKNLFSARQGSFKRIVTCICIIALVVILLLVPFLRQGVSISSLGSKGYLKSVIGVIDFNAPYQTLPFEMNENQGIVFLSSYLKAIPKMITGLFKIPFNITYTMEGFQTRIGHYFGYSDYGVGWTYSPFSEAYISFGYVGLYILFPLLYSIIIYIRIHRKWYSGFDLGFDVMMIYQFFRGDLANFMQIWSMYALISVLIKYFNKRVTIGK